MRVSVLVPVYNKSKKELTRCFESILGQTYKDFELIITDDGSKPEVAAFLDVYVENNKMRCAGGIHCYHYLNGGVWVARNKGQEKASGEWVIHVNADDFISSMTIETALKGADKHENVDMVYWGLQDVAWPPSLNLDCGGDRLYANPVEERFHIRQDILCATPFCDVTCMVRREKAQPFNPELTGAEFEHQVRVIANCRAVYFVDRTFYNYVTSKNTISSSQADMKWRIASIKDFRDALITHGYKTIDEYLVVYALGIIHFVAGNNNSMYKVVNKSVIGEILRSTTIKENVYLTRKGKIIFVLFKAKQFILLNAILWIARRLKQRNKLNSALRDCAVVISTCDNYSDIWEPFFKLFNKFWSDNPYPVFVNSETLDCRDGNVTVTTLKARAKNLSWTRRLKEALERIDAEYIIFMLDDFFLYDYVNTPRVEECISYMRKDFNIAAIYFTSLSGQMKMEECTLSGLEKCSHTGTSKVNITLTIWRKSAFEYYLNHNETVWEFEANSLERSLNRSDTFYSFSRNTPLAIPYNFTKYGLFSGKWFKETVDLFKEHGITHDFSIRGFYDEYEFGLIPYVARKIKLDSYLVPCYSLRWDNPRIDTDKIVEEGYFTQVYDVSGAKSAAIWYPSASIYGHVVENFKCTIIFKAGATEVLESKDVFGNFSLYRGAMCFLRPGGCVYIISKSKQDISYITIEGSLSKHMSRDDLATAYGINVRAMPTKIKEQLDASRIYAETLLNPGNFVSFRIYSKLCFMYNGEYDEKGAIIDGKERFPGYFLQSYRIYKSADNIVRWDIGGTFGGFAIEGLQVEMIFCDDMPGYLESQNIKGDGVYVDGYWVFLSSTANLLFSLPDKCPEEIRISGNVLVPMPRKILRSVIYTDDLASEESEVSVDNIASEENEVSVDNIASENKNKNDLINLNGLWFALTRIKKGIKKYGIFGVINEVIRRALRR